MPMKEQTVGAHDAVDALAIDEASAFGPRLLRSTAQTCA
jgi:hypothetical protein